MNKNTEVLPFSLDLAIELLESETQNPHPVDFNYAWQWIGWTSKRQGKEVLLNNFIEGVDFLRISSKTPNGGRPSENISLTIDCFKMLGMMAKTQNKKLAAGPAKETKAGPHF